MLKELETAINTFDPTKHDGIKLTIGEAMRLQEELRELEKYRQKERLTQNLKAPPD